MPFSRVFESAPIVGRDEFVRDRIAEVERVIKDPDLTPRQRMSQLQNTGTMLFDQFFPEDMQAYLWEHKDLVQGRPATIGAVNNVEFIPTDETVRAANSATSVPAVTVPAVEYNPLPAQTKSERAP